MHILTPFNQVEMLDAMIDSGADEFYMGFADDAWQQRFGQFSDVNRLTLFKDCANRYILSDLQKIAGDIHQRGGALYITLNAPGYLKSQTKYLEQFLETLEEYQVDGVIASTPDLVSLILKYHLNPIASTMCGIVNSDIAKYYREIGMKRLILPRELSLQEIASIICKVDGVQYEAFIMRNGCRFMDANCLGLHGGECGAVCASIREHDASYYSQLVDAGYQWPQRMAAQRMIQTNELTGKYFHEYSCGQCAIYDLMQIGVDAVKIVGRLDDMEDVRRDVALTRQNIDIAEKCSSREDYLQKMQPAGDLNEYCRNGLSCYYPEARFAY